MLRRDERGVVTMLALPLAMVLVFAFWRLARVGQAVLERERVQDAADAAAFESAMLHARGMNALALLASVEAHTAGERAIVRETSRKVAEVMPVLATVAALEDNRTFYERELMVWSQALLPSDVDAELALDPRRPWSFERRSVAPRVGGEASLPVQAAGDRLRMWTQAENGNAMMQVWASAQPKVGEPALAQAEFYFACRDEWSQCEPAALVSLDWTARMRRLWSPAQLLKLRERDPIDAALRRTDAQLHSLLPEAPKVSALFHLLAGASPRWMH